MSYANKQSRFSVPLTFPKRCWKYLDSFFCRKPISVLEEDLVDYLKSKNIIEGGKHGLLSRDLPKSFYSRLNFSIDDISKKKSRLEINSWGIGVSLEEALSRGIGEALERFFLVQREIDLVASMENLRGDHKKFLSPYLLSQFSERQKRNAANLTIDDSDVFAWIWGEDIFSEKKILLPAQCVFWATTHLIEEPRIRDRNTNGSAGYFTKKEAVLYGVYESIERDGFLIFWLNKLSPPVIDLKSVTSLEFKEFYESVQKLSFEAIFLNTTTDLGIPTLTCVLVDNTQSDNKGIMVGSGTGWGVEAMMLNILRKTFLSYQVMKKRPSRDFKLPSNYQPFLEHGVGQHERISLWHPGTGMFPRFEFFIQGKTQALSEAFSLHSFKSVDEEYAWVLDIFRKKNYPVYFYEAEDKVLKKIGYYVVKVLIPDLVHFYLKEHLASVGNKRLKIVPTLLGYRAADTLNPWPHPFP